MSHGREFMLEYSTRMCRKHKEEGYAMTAPKIYQQFQQFPPLPGFTIMQNIKMLN